MGSHYGNVMGNQVEVKGSLSGSCGVQLWVGCLEFGIEGSPLALCNQDGEVPSFQMEEEEGSSRVQVSSTPPGLADGVGQLPVIAQASALGAQQLRLQL